MCCNERARCVEFASHADFSEENKTSHPKAIKYLLIASAICGTMFTGCAGGPQYSNLNQNGSLAPHNGNGMILIYRTPGLAGSGTRFYVWANNTRMPSQLSRGGLYSYEAAPGPVRLEYGAHNHDNSAGEDVADVLFGGAIAMIGDSMTADKRKLKVNVMPNETHYVLMDGIRLTEVRKEAAERDIQKCHWLNPSTR